MSPSSTNKISAGINGFGRFGLHLLRYWILHKNSSNFNLVYINDSYLTFIEIQTIINNDAYFDIKNCLKFEDSSIIVTFDDRSSRTIIYTNKPDNLIPWLGDVVLFFECSGRNTSKADCNKFLINSTKHVLISSTTENPDHITVFGFNHTLHNANHKVISYGSCTVNAFVPLAVAIHNKFHIIDCDVHIIHNVPDYKLKNFNSLKRKNCTLENIGPVLLPFLKDNFKVTYTLVPFSGVSIIDYRFKLADNTDKHWTTKDIEKLLCNGALSKLYKMVDYDRGPEIHKFSPFSADIIRSSIKIHNNNLYFQAYFDNENSVTRYFDVANHIAARALE